MKSNVCCISVRILRRQKASLRQELASGNHNISPTKTVMETTPTGKPGSRVEMCGRKMRRQRWSYRARCWLWSRDRCEAQGQGQGRVCPGIDACVVYRLLRTVWREGGGFRFP
jgi:hypothetical protein